MKSWKYTAGSYIWRVMPTPEGLLIGEERDPVARTASFFCVDAGAGKVLWKRLPLGDGWWTGFAACARGVLLLHGYASPDLPQHLKVFAVDARTGRELWNNPAVTFAGVHGGEVYATTPAGTTVVLDLGSGSPLPVPEVLPAMDGPDTSIKFPAPLDLEKSSPFPGLLDLLGGRLDGPAEILPVGGFFVVTYCVRAGSGGPFTQMLTVIDPGRKKVVLTEQLLASTSMAVPDTCFSRGETLYYIRERRHLVGIRFPVPSPQLSGT